MTHYTPEEYRQVMALLEDDARIKTFEAALQLVREKNAPPETKKHKYNAVPTEIDGVRFDSKAEARRYVELKDKEKLGLIINLELQPKFDFVINGQKLPRTWYQADFRYVDVQTDEVIVEDVKGMITPIYTLKKKLMKAVHNIDVQEVTSRSRKNRKAA